MRRIITLVCLLIAAQCQQAVFALESKAIYQMVHFAEDNDGRIKRFRQAIFPEKK